MGSARHVHGVLNEVADALSWNKGGHISSLCWRPKRETCNFLASWCGTWWLGVAKHLTRCGQRLALEHLDGKEALQLV